ncbi:MAG: hypothetical protein PHY43_05510 [Verrucomicrobiales bacterium]|nr:hypothetical protein [Verrucomicrobiales bacterium]
MNSGTTLLAVFEPLPPWLNFLAMAVALLLGAFGVLLWAVMFRKRRRRKYHKHHEHRGERKLNPTLAEVGGLPPFRPTEEPNDQPPLP